MSFWIAVHLPRLSLDALQPSWPEAASESALTVSGTCAAAAGSTAGAVSARAATQAGLSDLVGGSLHHTVPVAVLEHERVVLANRPAMALGVRAGMRRGGVQALSAEVVQLERDPAAEVRLMTAVALALLRFTPHLARTPALDPDADAATVMLDVTASLRLFGGHRALCRAVRVCVRQLGAIPQIGCGPTAHGAAWLAAVPLRVSRRGVIERPGRRAVKTARMDRLLDRMPVAMLHGLTDPAWLDGIGCRTVGEVRCLPRAGLKRRLGTALLDRLDQAYGDAPARFAWFAAPPAFAERMELPGRIESAAGVLVGAQRLLLALAGWLAVQQAGVTRFVLRLEHERYRRGADIVATPVAISLSQPSRESMHMSRLLQEKLDRLQFSAPVTGLALEVEAIDDYLPRSESLFPEPGGGVAELGRVLDTLVARLGRENVLRPQWQADHRPERANCWRAVDEAGGRNERGNERGNGRGNAGSTGMASKKISRAASSPACGSSAAPALPERPLWLLSQPLPLPVQHHRPCHGGALTLLSRPERIEAGWWDGGLATRDYFIAERADGLRCWIYRERPGREEREGRTGNGEYRWFLHGLFA